MVLSSALPVVSMTFDVAGAPARLSGGPSPATNIPVVHTLLIWQYSQLEPQKRYEKNGRVTAIILVQVVQALEQFSVCKVNVNRL